MAVTTERSADATAIRPFHVDFPEAALEDLRARLAATRFPERETVGDRTQGAQLAKVRESSTTGPLIMTGARSRPR